MTYRNRKVLQGIVFLILLACTASTLTGCSLFRKPKKPPIHIGDLGALSPEDIPPPIQLGAAGSTGESLPPLSPPAQYSGLTIEATEPPRVAPSGVVSELQTIHFPFDSSRIMPDEQRKLENNARWILANPGIMIQIEGHCDERGSVEYNLNLGQRRADSVREELYKLGVDPSTLTTISYGEERPLDPGSSEEAWAKNRRAQFLIY